MHSNQLILYRHHWRFVVFLLPLEALARGLGQLLNYPGDVEEDLMMNFQVTYDYYGSKQTHDLLPNGISFHPRAPLTPEGGNIAVTNDNRQLYCDLYLKYLLVDSVKEQFDAFKKGFAIVVEGDAIRLFEPSELQLLICGSPELDFSELEKSYFPRLSFLSFFQSLSLSLAVCLSLFVSLHSFFSLSHYIRCCLLRRLSQHTSRHSHVLGYRQNLLSRRGLEILHYTPSFFLTPQKRSLLAFATGSDRAPIGGLGKLRFFSSLHTHTI